ncbi:SUN-domain-containing protein [Apiospora phragmitis]|uniref:SUN-domain-containing protein n=1 Tax=Apiospora phragmitis TaxID=2905665 RepID=A0ABR1TVA0_9PEZI
MKTTIINLALAATLASAQPHNHGHGRFHHKRGGASPVENVEKRGDVVTTVVAATETAYVMGSKAKAGIDKGLFIVVGESTPTFTPPPASPTPTTEKKIMAQFFQKPEPSTTSTPTPTPEPTPTSSTPPPPAKSSSSSSGGFSGSGGSGLHADFPDGELPCEWESLAKYGAGFTAVQKVPTFQVGVKIANIITAIKGEGCENDSFCSYACPAGYVKTQWPVEQGATGQSVGGLHCLNGKLHLTQPDKKTLCEENAASLTIKNSLNEGVATCRTDYPGTENMIVPAWAGAGSTALLANIKSSDYYTWEGKDTTLQYYINPKGVAVEDACVWTSATNPDSAGNWAPTNLGVGQSRDGLVYLSIFPNTPTSSAKLDFNIKITGDVTDKCTLENGKYYTNGKETPTGCTTAYKEGANVVVEYY